MRLVVPRVPNRSERWPAGWADGGGECREHTRMSLPLTRCPTVAHLEAPARRWRGAVRQTALVPWMMPPQDEDLGLLREAIDRVGPDEPEQPPEELVEEW